MAKKHFRIEITVDIPYPTTFKYHDEANGLRAAISRAVASFRSEPKIKGRPMRHGTIKWFMIGSMPKGKNPTEEASISDEDFDEILEDLDETPCDENGEDITIGKDAFDVDEEPKKKKTKKTTKKVKKEESSISSLFNK